MIYIGIIVIIVMTVYFIGNINRNNKKDNTDDSIPNKKVEIINDKKSNSYVLHNGKVVKEGLSKEEFLNTLSEEEKERFLRGDVKVTSKQIKKTTHYHNGEKTTEELENNETAYDKKAINSCPNCGASISLDYKECPYCKTIIN